MKHVVFILGSYFPNYSAVGVCAQKVIECLGDDFRITVLSVRGNAGHARKERQGFVDIVRVETPDRARRLKLAPASSLYTRLLLKMHRLLTALKKLGAAETVDHALVQAYLRALDSLEIKADVVIPLVFPFESVLAALSYKSTNPHVSVFPYLFDDFVESRSLHLLAINRILKERRHLALERLMIDEADAVLAMRPLRAHFTRHFEPPLLQKIQFLEHPLLSLPAATPPKQDQSATTVSYTGSLMSNVREPDYMLQMLKLMPISSSVNIDFYVMGNNAHKIKDANISGWLHIKNHGHVAKERANLAVMQSNILLNLGEIRGKQVSSKVFEYMAAGKPIIHLASVANDAVAYILAKYPLALCLVQDPKQLQENARRCAEFIEHHKHRHLSYSTVAALYPEALPETTAEIMRKLFYKADE